jgi:hypothetical protein
VSAIEINKFATAGRLKELPPEQIEDITKCIRAAMSQKKIPLVDDEIIEWRIRQRAKFIHVRDFRMSPNVVANQVLVRLTFTDYGHQDNWELRVAPQLRASRINPRMIFRVFETPLYSVTPGWQKAFHQEIIRRVVQENMDLDKLRLWSEVSEKKQKRLVKTINRELTARELPDADGQWLVFRMRVYVMSTTRQRRRKFRCAFRKDEAVIHTRQLK